MQLNNSYTCIFDLEVAVFLACFSRAVLFPFVFSHLVSLQHFPFVNLGTVERLTLCYAVIYFYCIICSRLFGVLCVPRANKLNVAFVHRRFCELWVVKSNFGRHSCVQYLFLKGPWRQHTTLIYSKDLAVHISLQFFSFFLLDGNCAFIREFTLKRTHS